MINRCEFSGCNNKHYGRGLCEKHYQLACRHGLIALGPIKRKCLFCGSHFVTRNRRTLNCSPQCSDESHKVRNRARNKLQTEQTAKFECACRYCGDLFVTNKPSTEFYCTRACRRAVAAKRQRAYYSVNGTRERENARIKRINNSYGKEYQRLKRLHEPEKLRDANKRSWLKNGHKYLAANSAKYHSSAAVRDDVKRRNQEYIAKANASLLLVEQLETFSVDVFISNPRVNSHVKRRKGTRKNETRDKKAAALRLVRELEKNGIKALA